MITSGSIQTDAGDALGYYTDVAFWSALIATELTVDVADTSVNPLWILECAATGAVRLHTNRDRLGRTDVVGIEVASAIASGAAEAFRTGAPFSVDECDAIIRRMTP